MKTFIRILVIAVCFLASKPASAQFVEQSTYAATVGGSANAITLTVPNWSRNLVGVPLRFLPGSSNTGATTVNVQSLGAIAINKRTNAGLTALAGGEIRSGVMSSITYDGTVWVLSDTLGTFTDVNTLASTSLQYGLPYNMGLSASVGTNALTITLQTAAGGTPSATSPVIIPFRHSTIGTGLPQYVQVTGALSFTIASGSTMGCTSAVMCRIWIVAICSSGLSCTGSPGTDTVGICGFNARSGTSVAPINEAGLQSSASGTSGGSSAQTYYCNISSVTARAIRILGYIDIQEVTAGTWATSPTVVQIFGPGIKKPGDIVSSYSLTDSTMYTSTAGTTPTTVGVPVAASLTSAANLFRVRAVGATGPNNGSIVAQLSRGTGPTLFGVKISDAGLTTVTLEGYDAPNTTSSQSYYVAIWNASLASDTYWCRLASGAAATCVITVQEIMSSISPAVNDNWREVRETA